MTIRLQTPPFTPDPNDPAYYVQVAAYLAQQFGGEWEARQTARGFWFAARKEGA